MVNGTDLKDQKKSKKKSGFATIGFVFSILSVVAIPVPIIGFSPWLFYLPPVVILLAIIFSLIGLSSKKRKLAISGIVISGVVLVLLFVVVPTWLFFSLGSQGSLIHQD